MNVYATAQEVRQYLGHSKELIKDDQLLRRFVIQAARTFDTYTRRKFYPRYETIAYDHPCEARRLILDDDLLAINTLTTGNGATTIPSTDYYLLRGNSYSRMPYNIIELKVDVRYWEWQGTQQKANSLDGIWGYHNDWSNAWGDSGDTVLDSPLLVGGTSLTIANAEGTDERGLNPRFQVGQLIRFGSSATAEYAWIKEIAGAILTIDRGVNGSTAAEQANATTIYVYRPQMDIVHAVLALAAHLYRRKDSLGSIDDRPIASATGVMILPARLPAEVTDILNRYKGVYP